MIEEQGASTPSVAACACSLPDRSAPAFACEITPATTSSVGIVK